VDKSNGQVNADDRSLLEVELAVLPPGRYRVFWSVVARDGHRREGDFAFRVR
jgi:methionine-rich copper-binding protein CopC